MCMDVQIYLEEQRLESLHVGARITEGYVSTHRGTKAQTYQDLNTDAKSYENLTDPHT